MLERFELWASTVLSEYTMLQVGFLTACAVIACLFIFVMFLAWTDSHNVEEEESIKRSKERMGIK